MEISLFVSGQDLKQLISQQCRVDRDALKLISSGKVIDDFSVLKEQGVKVGIPMWYIIQSMILEGLENPISKNNYG